jgi:hypothetical protein
VKICGERVYSYPAVDAEGDTVDFRAHRPSRWMAMRHRTVPVATFKTASRNAI